ncbi:MAG: hypothetical protein ACLQVJ_05365 [Syntrophobacteraceae bacterium]
MGIDLYSQEGHMRFNFFGWGVIRTFAVIYGWEPMGTRAPEEFIVQSPEPDEPWWGTYATNDWQEVTAEDANNMANALRAGIEAIKNGECDADLMEMFFPDGLMERVKDIPPAVEVRQNIIKLSEDFIEFCKGAPFRIG